MGSDGEDHNEGLLLFTLEGEKKKPPSENLKFLRLGFIVMLNFKLTF